MPHSQSKEHRASSEKIRSRVKRGTRSFKRRSRHRYAGAKSLEKTVSVQIPCLTALTLKSSTLVTCWGCKMTVRLAQCRVARTKLQNCYLKTRQKSVESSRLTWELSCLSRTNHYLSQPLEEGKTNHHHISPSVNLQNGASRVNKTDPLSSSRNTSQ